MICRNSGACRHNDVLRLRGDSRLCDNGQFCGGGSDAPDAVLDDARHAGHLGVMGVTGAALVLAQCLADKQGYSVSAQSEVGEHVVVDFLHHIGPVGVAVVRAALV